MNQPFRFGVVIANAPSRTAFVTLARRAEELGYSTLLMPDRTDHGPCPTHGAGHSCGGNDIAPRWQLCVL